EGKGQLACTAPVAGADGRAHAGAGVRAGAIALALLRGAPTSPLFPYTTLFRSSPGRPFFARNAIRRSPSSFTRFTRPPAKRVKRSEEHTSELQSRGQLVCRLLLEKKNQIKVLFTARRISLKHGWSKTGLPLPRP